MTSARMRFKAAVPMEESFSPDRHRLMTSAMRWKSSKLAPFGILTTRFSTKPASVIKTAMTRPSPSGKNCSVRKAASSSCGARTSARFFVSREMIFAVS